MLPECGARRYSGELQPVIGMFINTLPLCLVHLDDISAIDAVRAMQVVVDQALQHAHVPLFQIVARLAGRSTTSHSFLTPPTLLPK